MFCGYSCIIKAEKSNDEIKKTNQKHNFIINRSNNKRKEKKGNVNRFAKIY